MSKKNISSIVFLLIFVLAVAAYFIYPRFTKTDADPLTMIPDNSALILQLDHPSDFVQKLFDGNSIWQSALKANEIKVLEEKILSIGKLLKGNTSYLELLINSPLIISFHADKQKEEIISLFLSQIKTQPNIDDLQSLLSDKIDRKYIISKNTLGGIAIMDTTNKQSIYLVFIDGVMLASDNLELIEQSVKTYNSKQANFSAKSDFTTVKKTSGKKVDAKVYVNYKNFAELLKLFSSSDSFAALDWMGGFASWTETDLFLKDDEILLTGFTSFSNDSTSYLNLIKNQVAQKNQVYNLCPFNTNILLRLGFSSFSDYFYGLHNTKATIEGLNYNIDKLLNLIGTEAAIGFNSNNLSNFEEKAFAVVHFKDRHRGEVILKEIANITKGKKTSKFNGYSINQIKNKNILSGLFGSAFKPITNNYYLFIGDYAVFANSKETLIGILQMYDTGKTLDLNDNFKKYSDNLTGSENVSLFIKPGSLLKLLPEFIQTQTGETLMSAKEAINNVQGMSFQFSNDGPLTYTNIYLKLGKTTVEENLALWKISLDDEIVGTPSLVRDHSSNKYFVLVFDKSSNMYLIGTDGQLLWKKRIDGLPQGEIHQVDFFKNSKIQYLFNTRDFIYLIDKNGNYVKNYPKKLNPSSTNGLNVFDYNNKKDYRLLLAQADKKVYNYYLNGDRVNGWKETRTQNIVNEKVSRVVANRKDYFLITDIDNKTSIVNRRGQERIKIKGNLQKARNSEFYVNKTNSKGIILTTNEQGKLSYIKTNGKLDQTDFGSFSKDHFFLYEDFNDDNSVDFIFVDGRKLKIYDRFKKELFAYDFESEIFIKPMFFSLGRKQSVLGVVANEEKTIYLFDSKGNTIISRGLVGETPFTVGSLNNNKELNLITASGSILYNYRLK